jgi:hypothetical protein
MRVLFAVVTQILSVITSNSKRAAVCPPHTVAMKPKLLSLSVYSVTEVNFVFCHLGNGDLLNKTTARNVFPRSGLVGHCPSTQVKSPLQIDPVSKVARAFVILHVNKHNITAIPYQKITNLKARRLLN